MANVEKEKIGGEIDTEQSSEERTTRSSMPLMIGLLAVAGVLFIAGIAAVTGHMFAFMNNRSGFSSRFDGPTAFMHRGGGYRSHGGMMLFSNSNTNKDVVSGVVISTDGDNFIIAGGGNQYTVSTTGDTTFNTNDKKVTVNDSVIVIGTVTDKTITASGVRIVNY